MTERLAAPFEVVSGDETVADEEIIREVRAGDDRRFAILMTRYNQRLYRVCRAVLSSDSEAEEAVQEAYLKAYRNLDGFEHRAKFSTWLTKIAFHEALARKRRLWRWLPLDLVGPGGNRVSPEPVTSAKNPEGEAIHQELAGSLERAIDDLPEQYRTVFVLRHIEGLSTGETSTCLGLSREAVKSRLLRSRRILQSNLRDHYGRQEVFPFLGDRCGRLTERVLQLIQA